MSEPDPAAGDRPGRREAMAPSRLADIDGRLIAFGAFTVLASAAVLGRVVWDADVLGAIGVPTHELAFVDARNIASAAECRALGHDPLVTNPCDPLERPLNYPRIWLALQFIGVDQTRTVPLGLVFVASFLGALYPLLGRLSSRQGLILALALCSPAVLFAVERGQNDLVVFALIASAAVLWRRGEPGPTSTPTIVTAAAVLKLFPAAGLGAGLLARHVRAGLVAIACGVVVLGYFVATLSDLRAIAAALPQGQHHAYGARILVSAVARTLDPAAWEALGVWRQVVAVSPLAVAAVAAWRWVPGRRQVPTGTVSWRRHALHLGALVYVGTFATGGSWDYRLVFLLLALPQLFAWLHEPERDVRRASGLVVAVLITQLWIGALAAERTLADELVSWALALAGTALLAVDARQTWRWLRAGRPATPASPVRRP